MIFWIPFFFISAGLVLARMVSSEGYFDNPIGFVFLAAMLAGFWGCLSAVTLWQRVRDRGWDVSFPSFLVGSYEFPGLFIGARRIISRTDWETVPSYDPNKTAVENLITCLRMTRSWDEMMERDRRLVPVYSAQHRELAEYVGTVLSNAGILSFLDDTTVGGIYRFSFGTRVMVAARFEEEARHILLEHFGEGDEVDGTNGEFIADSMT